MPPATITRALERRLDVSHAPAGSTGHREDVEPFPRQGVVGVPDDVDDDLAQITLAGAVGDGDGRWWSVEGALLGDQRGDLLQGGRAGQLPELGGDVGDLAGVGDEIGRAHV